MRAGPLSDPEVVSTLSRYFVPVLSNNQPDKGLPTDNRIRIESVHADLGRPNVDVVVAVFGSNQVANMLGPVEARKVRPNDSFDRKPEQRAAMEYKAYVPPGPDPVFAYIVSPEGHPIGFLRTEEILTQTNRTSALLTNLQSQIKRLGLKAGEPMPVKRPQAAEGEVLLHLVTRYVGEPSYNSADGESIVHSITVFRQFPAEAWVRLGKADQSKFFPPAGASVGTSWTVPAEVADKIYINCFPPTEVSRGVFTKVVSQEMKATLEADKNGLATVRLSGQLRLKHPWWDHDEEKYVDASFRGFVEVDTAAQVVKSFRLTCDQAHYYASDKTVEAPFGIAVSNI